MYSNKRKASLYLGFDKSYFNKCNKTLFRFSRLYGKGNLVKGYQSFTDYQDTIYNKFIELYFSMNRNDFINSVYWLYSSKESARKAIDDYLSKGVPLMSFRGIKMIKRIVKVYSNGR